MIRREKDIRWKQYTEKDARMTYSFKEQLFDEECII